jgi:rfaE bifunctional protein nucleotidyltransferase chain/domain
VCASGSFDLLHPGHIRLLEQARALGDVLVVALESDASIRSANRSPGGPARPITPASERAEILAALEAVDYVVEFHQTSVREALTQFLPDVIAKGGSEGSDEAAFLESSEFEALGCRVVRIPVEPGYSTIQLIERIQEPRA